MSITATANLAALTAEIREINEANGWHEDERNLATSSALLHSEIAEAFEAWRDHGFEDQTAHVSAYGCIPKPLGVGSELADILIRLLDTVERHEFRPFWRGRDLSEVTGTKLGHISGVETFPEQVNMLHNLVAQGYFTAILPFLLAVAEGAGIDLVAETHRKLAYNRTRGYRHGGKRV